MGSCEALSLLKTSTRSAYSGGKLIASLVEVGVVLGFRVILDRQRS